MLGIYNCFQIDIMLGNGRFEMGIQLMFFCALCIAISNLCMRRSIDSGGTSKAYLMVQLTLSALIMVLLNPVRTGNYTWDTSMALFGLMGGILLACVMGFLGKALETGPPGLSVALLSCSSVMPILMMVLLFGARFGFYYTLWNALGSILVIVGICWAGWDMNEIANRRKVLTQSKYSERVLFPLAEIHRLLREDDRAVSLYLNLAQKYPEHRERFLFQAAILQIKEDKKEAIQTFYKVHEMGGKRSKLAAFNRLILMYQTEDYEGFLTYHQNVIALMPDQKVPLLNFYEGRCHYSLGDYQQAVMPLENFIIATKGRSKELKTTFLLLVNCSRYLKDIALLERTLFSYKNAFPKDAEVPKVLMIHSQMCRENGNFNQALSDLKTLTTDYPGYEDAEAVRYDYALLLSQTDKWIEAREMFLAFLDEYPQSKRKNAAWRHLLNCCIEEIKNPSQVNSDTSKETFVSILSHALEENHVLTDKEKQQYALVMMKCLCELERYEEVVPMLSQYIADTVDPGFFGRSASFNGYQHAKAP